MRKKNIIILCTLICCLVWIHGALAETTKEEKKGPWDREGEIGALITTGNSETESANGKLKLNYEVTSWFNKANMNAAYSAQKVNNEDGTSDKEKSTQKFFAADKIGYNLDERNYLFTAATYDYDLFSGYYYQATASPGYGRHLIKTDKIALDVEVGPGYRYSSVREPGDGDNESEAIFRGAGLFNYKFTDKTSFEQDIFVESGSENTITKSITALTAQVVGDLAMKTSYTVKNNSEPPVIDGKQAKKTDTETAVTLVFSF